MTEQEKLKKLDKRSLIIQAGTQLMNTNGAEQLSLRQVARFLDCNLPDITGIVSNSDVLVVYCLEKASESLASNILSSTYLAESKSILNLWYTLIDFGCLHTHESGLIKRFFKSPSLFPYFKIPRHLLAAIDQKLKCSNHEMDNCNKSLRLIVFTYLMNAAFSLSARLASGNNRDRSIIVNTYFFNYVEPELNRLFRLPIC